MNHHSIANANGRTQAKIAFVAVAMSALFVALISATANTRTDARIAGPAAKPAPVMMLATSDGRLVR